MSQTAASPITDDQNPYLPPHELTAFEEISSLEPKRRIRWRVIPVTFLYLYGGNLVLGGLVGYALCSWIYFQHETHFPGLSYANVKWLAIASLFLIALGSFALYAGYSLWKGRWWRAITACSFVILSYAGLALFAAKYSL